MMSDLTIRRFVATSGRSAWSVSIPAVISSSVQPASRSIFRANPTAMSETSSGARITRPIRCHGLCEVEASSIALAHWTERLIRLADCDNDRVGMARSIPVLVSSQLLLSSPI